MRPLMLILALAACANAQSPRGTTTAADHTFERAGHSNVVASWARPSQAPKYMPGYIGGSIPFGGGAPIAPVDGVFGYDYVGYGPPGRVFLGWAHDPTYPRMGPYRTDGPRVFDIFSIRPVRRALSPGEKSE
jgi:hypothetical protein